METERILKKGDVRQVGQVLGQTRSWGEIGSGSTRVREETPEWGNLAPKLPRAAGCYEYYDERA